MEKAEWPSAVVALGILALITAVGITAMVKYNAEQALKIWGALSGITGVVTGAFVTYFFTREPIKEAREQRDTAEARTLDLEEQLNIVKTDPSVFPVLQERAVHNPEIRRVLEDVPTSGRFTRNDPRRDPAPRP